MTNNDKQPASSSNFLRSIIESDLAAGTYAAAVDIAISVDGLTGDQVQLVITGAEP